MSAVPVIFTVVVRMDFPQPEWQKPTKGALAELEDDR